MEPTLKNKYNLKQKERMSHTRYVGIWTYRTVCMFFRPLPYPNPFLQTEGLFLCNRSGLLRGGGLAGDVTDIKDTLSSPSDVPAATTSRQSPDAGRHHSDAVMVIRAFCGEMPL